MATRYYSRNNPYASRNQISGGHRFVARGKRLSGFARRDGYRRAWEVLAALYPLGDVHESCSQGHRRKGCTPCFERAMAQWGYDVQGYKETLLWPRQRARIMNRWKSYGLTQGTYEEMWQAQGGRCGLCGEQEPVALDGMVKVFAVDHSHVTGKIRGLLCAGCNLALGHVEKKGLAWMRAAALYLRTHMSEEERERFVKQKS